MAGLRELSALAANANELATSSGRQLVVSEADRGKGASLKRRRTEGFGQLRLPCSDSLEALRSVLEEFEAAALAVANRLAERESAVTVREVACCSVEARLAQRSSQLEDWEGRLHEKAGALEQEQQVRMRRPQANKENALPEDSQSDAEAAESPAASMQGGAGFWAPQQQPGEWQPNNEPSSFQGFWAEGNPHASLKVEPSVPVVQQPEEPKQATPRLHFAALDSDSQGNPRIGVRLACSTPTPANSLTSLDSQSHGSADTATAGHAVHSRPVAAHAGTPQAYDGQDPSSRRQTPEPIVRQLQRAEGMPCKLSMKLAKLEGQQQAGNAVAPWRQPPQPLASGDAAQKLDSLAKAAEVVESRQRSMESSRGRAVAALVPDLISMVGEAAAVAGPFVKHLDYKSCDHILCLTKDMARELFPQPPHSSAGGPTQAMVELEDDSGRMWQMTYRCVPHRYSYELRAGWKAFAQFWNVSVGDTVVLWRDPPPSSALRISIRALASHAPCPAAATRHHKLYAA